MSQTQNNSGNSKLILWRLGRIYVYTYILPSIHLAGSLENAGVLWMLTCSSVLPKFQQDGLSQICHWIDGTPSWQAGLVGKENLISTGNTDCFKTPNPPNPQTRHILLRFSHNLNKQTKPLTKNYYCGCQWCSPSSLETCEVQSAGPDTLNLETRWAFGLPVPDLFLFFLLTVLESCFFF